MKRRGRVSHDKKKGANRYAVLWHSRGFVAVLLVVVVLISISVTKEGMRRFEMRQDIDQLETEVARLEGRNMEVQDVIALLNTSTAQDKQARVKLNVQSSGEQMVVFPNRQKPTEIVLPDSDKIEYIPVKDFESNPEKWFYFFWDRLSNTS